jgi:protein SCO1
MTFRLQRLFAASLAAVLILVAAGCTDRSDTPRFKLTDVTGASFGKELALTDHNGQHRTLADFHGKVIAVFFGFTHCPDVCPTTLVEMAAVMKELGGDAGRVQVLFVTVDPERDTPEVLATFVPWFDARFLGLYGDAQTTLDVAREFKVFYSKVKGETALGYSIDHSAASYAYDPQGRLRLLVRHGETPEHIAADLHKLLAGK